MINQFKEVTKSTEDNFEEYLKRIALFEVFEPIFLTWGKEPEIVKSIIQYIFYGYSIESDQLPTKGSDWKFKSKQLFDKVGLPSKLEGPILKLENPAIQKSVHSFLWYQNDENWTEYCLYRDLRLQMQTYALLPGTVKEKMDAAVNSGELLKMMDTARQRFIDNNDKLKKQVEEITKKSQETNVKSFGQMLKDADAATAQDRSNWGAFSADPVTEQEG